MSKQNKDDKQKTVLFAASTGGHFEQLMMLRPLMEEYNGIVVTEKTKYGVNVKGLPVKYMIQVNRKELLFPFKMIGNAFKALGLLIKYKPYAVITTGVLAMIPLAVMCKWFGAKLIYIESFAKINSPNMTGKFLYKRADRFYVQWEEMLKIYPDAVYVGGIY